MVPEGCFLVSRAEKQIPRQKDWQCSISRVVCVQRRSADAWIGESSGWHFGEGCSSLLVLLPCWPPCSCPIKYPIDSHLWLLCLESGLLLLQFRGGCGGNFPCGFTVMIRGCDYFLPFLSFLSPPNNLPIPPNTPSTPLPIVSVTP